MGDIIYTSDSHAKSLWQKYTIYCDRVEFETLLGNLVVPFEQIEGVMVSESEIKGLMRGDLHLKNFKPALKLDWANFTEHLVLDKNTGHVKRMLFTPENPEEFKLMLLTAMQDYLQNRGV
jgi:hypothetical protein